jgi:NAD(P)-dependent dehydrogenase (short-subunit alcohol dehydrogenase family)
MDLGLDGKVAIVTGGSKGIGLAIAEALVREGAQVFLCARGREALEAAVNRLGQNGEVGFEVADVSQAEDCERTVAACRKTFGKVDILVNNAGGLSGGAGGFLNLSDDDWLGTYQATLMSAVRMSRLTIPEMAQRRSGRIVMIASTSGRQPDVVVPHYSAAKAAMISLSKTLANAFAADQILVNCVCPGLVRTQAMENTAHHRLEEEGVATAGMTLDEMVNRYFGPRRPIPVGRIGTPQDIGGIVAFLCSQQASWLTGACIDVDGGWVKAMV